MPDARKWVADLHQEIFIGGYKFLSKQVEVERFFVLESGRGFSYGLSRHPSTLRFSSPHRDVPEYIHTTPEAAFRYFVNGRIESLKLSIMSHRESIREDKIEIDKLKSLKFEDVPIRKTDPNYESIDW